MGIPSIYLESKLFHRPVRDDRDNTNRDRKPKLLANKSESIPDPRYEDIEPDADNALEVAKNITNKAIDLLRSITKKANPGSTAIVPETEGQRATGFIGGHDTAGVRGVETPDSHPSKPEPHNTNVDRPPENLVDEQLPSDKAIKRIMGDAHDAAKKAFVAAPRFAPPGPFLAPREKDFLKLHGYSDEDINNGFVMSPRLRAAFNKWLTATVQKSISGLLP